MSAARPLETAAVPAQPAPVARPALVIFDMDGCLVDSEPIALEELVRLLDEAGAPVTMDEALGRLLGVSVAQTAAWAEREGGRIGAAEFEAVWHERLIARYRRELRPTPGAVALLERLGAAGVPFGLATGASTVRMRASLEIAGLDGYFPPGTAHSADMVAAGKPAPDLFLRAAELRGVRPEACLVVEDAPAGVTAAVRAGMTVFGFVGGAHLADRRERHGETLRALGAREIHDDLAALAPLIAANA